MGGRDRSAPFAESKQRRGPLGTGPISIYLGKPLAAIAPWSGPSASIPSSPTVYIHFLGLAHLVAGNYETAAASIQRADRADAGDRFFARLSCRPLLAISGESTRPAASGPSSGDQPQVFVRRAYRSVAIQGRSGRGTDYRRAKKGRLAELVGLLGRGRRGLVAVVNSALLLPPRTAITGRWSGPAWGRPENCRNVLAGAFCKPSVVHH